MTIHHFAYLFGTDELLVKGELLVLMLSGNLDIINICLCFNTCALTITQHLLMSVQGDLWAQLLDPEAVLWHQPLACVCCSVHQGDVASSVLGQCRKRS